LGLAFVAGLLAGLACMTRPSFLAAAGLLSLGLWLWPASLMRWGRRSALVALFALGTALAIAPVTLRNYQIHGRFILVSTNGPSTFYTGHVTHQISVPVDTPDGMTDADIADLHRRESLRYLRGHWPTYLAEIPEFFLEIWLSTDFWPNATTYWQYRPALDPKRPSRIRLVVDEAGGPPFGSITYFPDLVRYVDALVWLIVGLPLGALALLFLPRENRRWVALYMVLAAYLIVPFISWPLARYRIGAVPLVFVLCGQTVWALWQWRRGVRGE